MTRSEHPETLSLPVAAFAELRASFLRELDPEKVSDAFDASGARIGESFLPALTAELGSDDPATLEVDHFLRTLADFLAERGWGRPVHERLHPGLGVLRIVEGGEGSAGANGAGHPSCPATAGVLRAILGRLSGAPVALVEVSCRGRGDGECAFAFGSEQAVQGLAALLADRDLESALSEL